MQCSNSIVAFSKAFKYKQTLSKVGSKRPLYYFHIIMYYFVYISFEISICSAFIHWLLMNNVIMVVFVFSTSSAVGINLAHTHRKRDIFLRREEVLNSFDINLKWFHRSWFWLYACLTGFGSNSKVSMELTRKRNKIGQNGL